MMTRLKQAAVRHLDTQSKDPLITLRKSPSTFRTDGRMHRRSFVSGFVRLLSCLSIFGSGAIGFAATTRSRTLPADADLSNLLYEDPADLDSHELPINTIDQFGVGGTDDHYADMHTWRLQFAGLMQQPVSLNYAQLSDLPLLERKVLLICPGTFAYVAKWQGFSLWDLLRQHGLSQKATHVDIMGPPEKYRKIERFSLKAVQKNSIFLATRVNGQRLPLQHGFPLRLVAQGHVGAAWLKYVYRIEAIRDTETGRIEKTKSAGSPFFP